MTQDQTLDIRNERQAYYTDDSVRFELLRSMRDREVVFISRTESGHAIRGLFIRSIRMFTEILEFYRFFDKDYNIYVSLATYDGMPVFPWDLRQRSAQTQLFFDNQAGVSMTGFDILLDFDRELVNQNYNLMIRDVTKAVAILDYEQIPRRIVHSGSNFQVVIPCLATPHLAGQFVKNFKQVFNLESLDPTGCGIQNKVRKCEYSLVDNRVCLPVHDMKSIDYPVKVGWNCSQIRQDFNLGHRGLMTWNDFKMSSAPVDRFAKFVKKYFLDKVI